MRRNKKSIAFNATSSKGKKKKESSDDEYEDDISRSIIDEGVMALFVRKFGKIMKKKGYERSMSQISHNRRCFECGRKDHFVANCSKKN